jgi:hypothetical protein
MASHDFTEHRVSLDGGTLIFMRDGTMLLSLAIPTAGGDRYQVLADRLRELADQFAQPDSARSPACSASAK